MAQITTKIDKAIYDTELRLRDARDRRILICKEIEILEQQVDTLQLVKKDEKLS